uniref:Uncharacterized protein n=1 Tax=Amphimedon queenslandica TaxID=400682 RepID=A0A1X7UY26_AMPQE
MNSFDFSAPLMRKVHINVLYEKIFSGIKMSFDDISRVELIVSWAARLSINACYLINRFTRYDSGGKFVYFSIGDCSIPSNSDSLASNSQQTETDDASLFKLPVLALQEAKAEHLVRSTDTIFLSHLKKRIKEDPAGSGVAPLAVVCISVDNISSFSEKWLSVYMYEVLGGQHNALAKKDLFKKNPAKSILKDVWAEVYVGLTSDEALHSGSRHNENGHFIHKMTLRLCKLKLVKEMSRSQKDNIERTGLKSFYPDYG